MIIDAHSHILSLAADPEFTVEYGREGSLCIYRSMGRVPSHRLPTEDEWEASGFSRSGWPLIGPDESRRDHPGFDKIVVLAVSPQYLDGHLIGTVDTSGLLGVEGPPDPEKCNDYIAAVVRTDPGRFIGFASVNITDVTAARASRVTPAITAAQSALSDAMSARDRECKNGVGKYCREREAAVAERRQILDSAMASVGQTADPQTNAAVKLVAWISQGMLRPSSDDFAMLRLVLLALLPQIGGILLMVSRSAMRPGES